MSRGTHYSYVNNNPLSLVDPTGFDAIDPITVIGVLGGPENPYADAAGVVAGIADVFGLASLFGGGGPTLTPAQQAAEAHGINLSSPLQGTPSLQSLGGTASFATEDASSTVPQIVVQASNSSVYGIASQLYSPFSVSANAATMGVDPDMVHEQVTISPSQSPDELDTINVNAWASHGFNWMNLIPGWSALVCGYYGCGAGNWALAAIGAIPPISVESGAMAPLARGGASLTNISANDVLRIQNAANRIGQQITVVGSRAAGTANAASDWDYVINGSSKALNSVSGSLPGAGSVSEGLIKNLDIFRGDVWDGFPSITFFPQ